MSTQSVHPKWWQVYVLVLGLLGLFWLETHARLTGTDHVIAELGILVLIFGSVRAWLKANRSALMESDPTEAGWGVGICDIPEAKMYPADEAEDEPARQAIHTLASAAIQGDLKDASSWDGQGAASGAFAKMRLVSKR
jgi:hypothetical protein